MALLLARSALFPASAITIFGLACRWSSFTQFLARVNVSFRKKKNMQKHDSVLLHFKSLMQLSCASEKTKGLQPSLESSNQPKLAERGLSPQMTRGRLTSRPM